MLKWRKKMTPEEQTKILVNLYQIRRNLFYAEEAIMNGKSARVMEYLNWSMRELGEAKGTIKCLKYEGVDFADKEL